MVDRLRLNLARVSLILRLHILVNDLALMKILGLDYAAHHQLLRLLARLLLNQLLDLHRLLLRLKRFLIGRLLADVLSIYHLFDIELLYLLVLLQDKLALVVRGCDIHKQFSQQLHQPVKFTKVREVNIRSGVQAAGNHGLSVDVCARWCTCAWGSSAGQAVEIQFTHLR